MTPEEEAKRTQDNAAIGLGLEYIHKKIHLAIEKGEDHIVYRTENSRTVVTYLVNKLRIKGYTVSGLGSDVRQTRQGDQVTYWTFQVSGW